LALPLWGIAFDPLSIAGGARAIGMGKAQVAVVNEANTIFTNPAGLGEIDTFKFSSMSGNVLDDLHYLSLCSTFSLGNRSAVGIGYAGAFLGGIELRDTAGTLGSKANYGNTVAVISYGRQLARDTSFGLNLKYYSIDGTGNDNGDGRGWNADLGFYQDGLNWISFGLTMQNLLSSSKILYQNGESEPLPQTLRLGTKMYLLGGGFSSARHYPFDLTVAVDGQFDLNHPTSPTIFSGLEFSPNEHLAVRAGSNRGTLTAGISFMTLGLGFHYAYNNLGDDPTNLAHYFSITFDEKGWPSEEIPDIHISMKP